ncbi:DUF5694 domain-containing protein [Maribacter sp. IgM3_T14_3]|uniref:DUF5694 domain-containing protein n=1 Tax=Maribacter sp. IgM3_T14_3 TaxID=3415140 RepID=UPI003C6FBB76
MKKPIYLMLILLIWGSCKEQIEKEPKEKESLEISENIENPNEFIGEHKAKAMVLGVFHFSNPNLDSYKEKFEVDIFSKEKQEEIEKLLIDLAKYNPTKILLEWDRIKMDSIANDRYQKYLKGEFSIEDKSNEVYQLGFRLAKKLGHQRIYTSDASADWFGADLDWDSFDEDEYLKSKGQYEKSRRYDYDKIWEVEDSLKTVQTLSEHFRFLNDPNSTLKSHQQYLTNGVLEGAGDLYLGADGIARWYRRNLRIFSNTYDLTEFSSEERVLLIYGQGHVWQLRQFFTDSPDYDYIEINDYLTE